MIGIFGDSYAHEFNTTGWPTILSELYNEQFENFAVSGSSIPYSYDLLCEKDLNRYSKVIFVSTEPRRLHFIDKKTNKELLWNGRDAKGSLAVNNYKTYSSYEKPNPLSSSDKKILQYQEHINAMYPDTWDSMAQAMKNDVLRSHKNILLLDIYELVNITELDNPCEYWWETYKETSNGRECHMSIQQNVELAGYIKDYFDNGFDIHGILNPINTKEYFTTSKSIEEAGYIKING
jgi:hypothetical protein